MLIVPSPPGAVWDPGPASQPSLSRTPPISGAIPCAPQRWSVRRSCTSRRWPSTSHGGNLVSNQCWTQGPSAHRTLGPPVSSETERVRQLGGLVRHPASHRTHGVPRTLTSPCPCAVPHHCPWVESGLGSTSERPPRPVQSGAREQVTHPHAPPVWAPLRFLAGPRGAPRPTDSLEKPVPHRAPNPRPRPRAGLTLPGESAEEKVGRSEAQCLGLENTRGNSGTEGGGGGQDN